MDIPLFKNLLKSSPEPPVSTEEPPAGPSEDLDWPSGYVRRVCPAHLNEANTLNENKWAWRSVGYRQRDGRQAETRICLGTIQCSNAACTRPVRPLTQSAPRRNQLAEPCHFCGSVLAHIDCSARCFRFSTLVHGQLYLVWEHDGLHHHPRPPVPRTLSIVERESVDRQIANSFGATAHQLRTGSALNPNSIPLHEISDVLANARSARYQIAQSQARQGIPTASTMRGGFTTLTSLADLKDKNGEPFLIDSSLSGAPYLMFRTGFMKEMLLESIKEWEEEDPRADGRHGLVTDGCHSFFRDGVIVATCVFNSKLAAWVPVLYTWIGGESANHFRPHFREISQLIVDSMGARFDQKYLLHVMDFSAAQQKAHDAEFVEAVMKSLGPLLASLDPAAVDAQRAAILSKVARIGCNMHFLTSVTRIRDTAALIPPDLIPRFMASIKVMMGNETTESQFDNVAASLSREFPRIRNWLKWWMQPWVMAMVFPAKSPVPSYVRDQVPSTSNPVEHQHHLLNHATTKDQDLIPGAMALLKHVQEREAQYRAIESVWNPPTKPTKTRQRKKKAEYVNDGRAPDTVARLALANSKKTPKSAISTEEVRPTVSTEVSYKWAHSNSCFYDTSMEVWYRALQRWSPDELGDLSSLVPTNSFLSFLVNHVNRRMELDSGNRAAPGYHRQVSQVLYLGQTQVRSFIVDRWKLAGPDDYFCAASWLHHAVRDSNTSVAAQARFGIQQLVRSRCSHNHITLGYNPASPPTLTNIELSVVSFLRELYPHVALTPQHYFAHYIPRNASGHPIQASSTQCAEVAELANTLVCRAPTSITDVQFSWPKLLSCCTLGQLPTLTEDSLYPASLTWPEVFQIDDPIDGVPVVYEYIGRVLHSANHYTAEVRIEDQYYMYNDMLNAVDGHDFVHLSTSSFGASVGNKATASYVYNRTSVKDTVRAYLYILADNLQLLIHLVAYYVDITFTCCH
ncbi:hypothetical protein DFP72DRAFT_814081 [Ephemerocybe angulata]|uniref:GCM domain-containing protein n=1 Tax=Ephemerocybe angulata TaxID=980116 RepID=A0A8H6M2S0_9AGAR|nr:hypothetical protein DFP72DRAFT_814081 [Tulosesus angulatus]